MHGRSRRPALQAPVGRSTTDWTRRAAAREDHLLPSRGTFAAWATLIVVAIVYVSVVVGPLGFHFVPMTLDEAWQTFLRTRYVQLGSDQQPDWMANLLMFVPAGFLMAGTFWPRRAKGSRVVAAVAALVVSVGLVLVIKFAQLYFPPRTVTLNYILAQSLGSLVGILLFGLLARRLFAVARAVLAGGQRALDGALALYCVALFFFFLFPLDFVLTAADLSHRLEGLPQLLFTWPGVGRPMAIRLVLLVAGTASTIPLGMLIAARRPLMSVRRATVLGFILMAMVTAATVMVQSASPSLFAILYRTVGIAAGAAIRRRMYIVPVARWQAVAARAVPWILPPYVLAVLLVNGLLTTHWRSFAEALAAFDSRGLIPFWNYYIVSKAQATASLIVHALMFAPVGMMVWLRYGGGAGATSFAVGAAFVFAVIVEIGRWMRPGLLPDISDAFVAAAAAGLALKLMPTVFRMLSRTSGDEPMSRPKDDARPVPARQVVIGHNGAGMSANPAAWAVGVVLVTLAAIIAARYPVLPVPMAALVAVYGICLWRWPGIWMVVIPAALPVLDLTPWTGWAYLGVPDLLVLATLAVLAIRVPLQREDLVPAGLSGWVVVLYALVTIVAVAIGLGVAGPAGGSDNPYLRPDNALRLAKGLFVALALWPFLRQRLRTRGDAVALFGVGMVVGLALEGMVVLFERALFPGILDFATAYRVVGTFSGMHLGGGLIGAYLAMALPFLVVGLLRARATHVLAVLAVAALAGYALVVTFARTAYAAALIGMIVAVVNWAMAAGRGRRSRATAVVLPAVVLATLGATVLVATFDSQFMEARFRTTGSDLGTREENWSGGLALRDDTVMAQLLGMGLGTFPRIALDRRAPTHAPSNFVVREEGRTTYLSLTPRSSFYLVQRVPIAPGRSYRLILKVRSPSGPARLAAALCENVLLYSYDCRGTALDVPVGTAWGEVTVPFRPARPDEPVLFGVFRRPTILSLSDPIRASTIEFTDVRLADDRGRNIVANGSFAAGMERWIFTDDDHLVWRIKNQYLMTLFETGALGLCAFLLLAGTALLGAIRAAAGGNLAAASVAGALVAFLCSCGFDYLLEVPRIATLFYMVALLGIGGFSVRARPA